MEEMKNSAMEFHDSEVSVIDVHSDDVVVKFSAAYVHRSEGQPGVDAGNGYVQSLELFCSGARVLIQEEGCVGSISDGKLVTGGVEMNLVPIPFESNSESSLEFVFRNGSRFCVKAQRVIISVKGEAKFIETFKC